MDDKKSTVTQMLNDIMTKICDEYCKYPYEVSKQEELDKVCENCPLGRI